MKLLFAAVALSLTGCATLGNIIAEDIEPPAQRYLQPLRKCVRPPENTMVNAVAKKLVENLTSACASNKQTARGLQRFANDLTSSKK